MKDLVETFAEARFGKEAFFKKLLGPAIDPKKKALRDRIEDMIREEQLKRDQAKTHIAYGQQRIEEAKKPSTLGLISDIARGMVPGLSITAAFDDPMIKKAITAHPGQYVFPLKNRIADVLKRFGSKAKDQIVARAGDLGDIGMKIGGGAKAVGQKALGGVTDARKYLKGLPLGHKLGLGTAGVLGTGLAASAGDEDWGGRAYDITHGLGVAGGAGTGYALQKGLLGGHRGAAALKEKVPDLAKKLLEQVEEPTIKGIKDPVKGALRAALDPGKTDLALAAQPREGVISGFSDLFSPARWKKRLGWGSSKDVPALPSQARGQIQTKAKQELTDRLASASAQAGQLEEYARRMQKQVLGTEGKAKVKLLKEITKATDDATALRSGIAKATTKLDDFFGGLTSRAATLGDDAVNALKSKVVEGGKGKIPALLRRGGKWGAILGGLGAAGLIGLPRILKARKFRASGGEAGREAVTKAEKLMAEAAELRKNRDLLMQRLSS